MAATSAAMTRGAHRSIFSLPGMTQVTRAHGVGSKIKAALGDQAREDNLNAAVTAWIDAIQSTASRGPEISHDQS
jgi:hypothetical protein